MQQTTLCYMEKDGAYLMLHRVSKKNDVNAGKWIGVGGKFEPGEAPEDCLVREVREETGYTLKSWRFRGIITFIYNNKEPEYIFTYTSDSFEHSYGEALSGTEPEAPYCDEGILRWIPKSEIMSLDMWEGDIYLMRYLLENREEPFSLKLSYHDDKLICAEELSGSRRVLSD